MTDKKYSIESLQQEKNSLRKQLEKNKANISLHWTTLFNPPEPDSKMQKWVNQAERAYAIYDGVMLGYKLFRRFNSFMSIFHRKKRRK